MRSRWIVLGLCLAMVCGFQTAPVRACPYCKADAAGLATCEAPPADDAASFPVMFSGGVDFASSYYFRGYLQADHGPIMQPYLNVFTSKTINEDLIIRPYVSLFNSTHFAPNNRMADMSDVMIGTVTSWNGFMLDSRYAYYNMSPLMRTPLHEIGAKVSYDVLNFWEGNDALKPFSLKPFVAAYGEFIPEQGQSQLFANVGFEPTWRFELAKTKVGLGLPIDWGLGGNGYYFNSNGSNAALGYFSTALTASVAIPVPEQYGKWFLNTSIQYLHLVADSVQVAGEGRDNVAIAKIGLSFIF
jgi:hypothetical protein